MALIADNLVLEVANGASAGLSEWLALNGTFPGYRTFGSRMVDNTTFHYLIRAVDVVARPTGDWELGRGAWRSNSGAPALQRLEVFASSNNNAPVAFVAGTKHVSIVHLAPVNDAIRFDQQSMLGLDMAGLVGYFAATTPPPGWLKANGAAISRSTYARLFARIGTAFGVGDGASTFNLPDARGEFLRGWDDGRTLDNGRGFATVQGSANLLHAHGLNDPGHAHGVYDPGHAHGAWTDTQGNHQHISGTSPTAIEVSGYGLTFGGAFVDRIAKMDPNGGYLTYANGNHAHNVGVGASGTGIAIYAAGTGQTVQSAGESEARPRNLALACFIKY